MVRDTVVFRPGLRLRSLEERNSLALDSSSMMISDAVATAALKTAARLGMETTPTFTYLANTIRSDSRGIPYSVVTALDLDAIAPGRAATPATPNPQAGASPMVLNAWAANDLGVRVGDPVSLDYYVWETAGRLSTRSADFRVAAIVPIEGAAADRDLVPVYPGITDSRRLSDWNPPFPIELRRVRPVDEDYWDRYRTTPKAFISIEKGQELCDPFRIADGARIRPTGARHLMLCDNGSALRSEPILRRSGSPSTTRACRVSPRRVARMTWLYHILQCVFVVGPAARGVRRRRSGCGDRVLQAGLDPSASERCFSERDSCSRRWAALRGWQALWPTAPSLCSGCARGGSMRSAQRR